MSNGYVGFIISRAFLEGYKADNLRGWLSKQTIINQVIDFQNFYVFSGVGITTAVLILHNKGFDKEGTVVYQLTQDKLQSGSLSPQLIDKKYFKRIEVSKNYFSHKPWVFYDQDVDRLIRKMDDGASQLGEILTIGQGMQTGRNNVFGGLDIGKLSLWGLQSGEFYNRVRNSDIQRYYIKFSEIGLLYLENYQNFTELPQEVGKYLKSHERELKQRAAYLRGDCEWWKFTWPLHKDFIDRDKLYCPYLAKENRFAIDTEQKYLGLTDTTVLFDSEQPEDLRFVLGLLNSKLLTFRFKFIGKLKSGGIYEYFWNSISKIPIRRLDTTNKFICSMYEEIVFQVELMQSNKKSIAEVRNPSEKELLQRQIIACDRRIDTLVYNLYGLTEEDIAIVEGTM